MWRLGARRQKPEITPRLAVVPFSPTTRFSWQKARYSPQARQFDIFTAAIRWSLVLGKELILPTKNQRHHRRQAQALVNHLISLGPTFIKLGQSLSTRIDFLPPTYVEALSQLHDRVPAFSSTEAIAIIESELGGTVDTLFAGFNPIPIAAASLGQVHRAKLRTGEAVVIKVQRPGLQRLFELDFQVIDKLLWWLSRIIPQHRSAELRAIYQEFFILLFQEIDYTKEGQNADRFRVNFKANRQVVAPPIHWRYTTTRVLTMGYLPGIKIDDRKTLEACGFNPKQINQLGICCYLKQLLSDGFFQADPHPGNMAIMADGKLVVYDFGMMIELKSLAKGQTIETFWAVMKKDCAGVTEGLVGMGLVIRVEDMRPIERVIGFMLEQFTDRPVDLKELDRVKDELTQLFIQQPFKLSPEITFIIKALTTLDGIARTLDPEYSLIVAAQPFIRSVAIAERGSIISSFGKQATGYLQYRLNRPSAAKLLIDKIEQILENTEQEHRIRSQITDRKIQQVYLTIYNLIYLCLTGFSTITAILLCSTHPLWSLPLWGIACLGTILWLKSTINLMIQTRLLK